MTTRELYCPECRKKTRHKILPDDRMSFNGNRVWRLSCDCGVFYSIQRKWSGLTEEIIDGLLSAREQCKMFWKPEEIEGEKKVANSEQINATSYYQLPSGKFLEDFIYYKGLNFNMGSALKYRWRAGHKDGESREKDLAKCEHYIRFETECRTMDRTSFSVTDSVRKELDALVFEANNWGGM